MVISQQLRLRYPAVMQQRLGEDNLQIFFFLGSEQLLYRSFIRVVLFDSNRRQFCGVRNTTNIFFTFQTYRDLESRFNKIHKNQFKNPTTDGKLQTMFL